MKNVFVILCFLISISAYSSGSNYCRSERGDVLELDFLSQKSGIYVDLVDPKISNLFFDSKTDFKKSETPGVYYAEKENIKMDLIVKKADSYSSEWPAIVHFYGEFDLLLPLTCGVE